MHRHQLVAVLGGITLAIAGCASEEAPPVATSPSPQASPASPQPVATASPQAGFAQPLVAQRPPIPASVPGLIQPTNPNERQKQVETEIKGDRGRDPFAGLPPVLPKGALPTPKPVPQVTQLPGTPGVSPSVPKKTASSPSAPKAQGQSSGSNASPSKTTKPNVATVPSTNTAEAVAVTGVITIGNDSRVIVLAPGDTSSRHVSVGERISNGKVLVKRIEAKDSDAPVVILEENGVEVAKTVGERPVTQQSAKPAA